MKKVTVIYHKNCMDGIASAWVIWMKWSQAKLIPYQYNEAYPEIEDCDHLYIVDMSFYRFQLLNYSQKAKIVSVFDHHKSATNELVGWDNKPDNIEIIFDLDRSGCQITWDQVVGLKPRFDIIDYVGDRDLWKFNLPLSKEVNAGILNICSDFTVESFEKVFVAMSDIEKFKAESIILQGGFDNLVKLIASKYKMIVIDEYKVAAVNTPIFISEVGNYLANNVDCDFAACYTMDADTTTIWSFRSIGDFDVSKVAENYGGGGHKNAAGCKNVRFRELGYKPIVGVVINGVDNGYVASISTNYVAETLVLKSRDSSEREQAEDTIEFLQAIKDIVLGYPNKYSNELHDIAMYLKNGNKGERNVEIKSWGTYFTGNEITDEQVRKIDNVLHGEDDE